MTDSKVDVFLPLYVGDYIRDTTRLNAEESGAYLHLLMELWTMQGEPLPVNPRQLARIAKVDSANWTNVWESIARFFDVKPSGITQKRLSAELERAREQKAAASEHGRRGAERRWGRQSDASQDARALPEDMPEQSAGNARGHAQLMPEQCSSPSPSPSPEDQRGPAGASARSPEPEQTQATPPGPMTGLGLLQTFGRIRSDLVGGLPWQVPPTAPGKAAAMAETIAADPASMLDVPGTIRRFFTKAKNGEYQNSGQILKNPSFAFGVWCSEFTALREDLHGSSPAAPPAAARGSPPPPARKPTPYCEWHLQPKTRGRKSHRPLPTCPECKHIAAGNGRRGGDPESIEALIAAANGPDPCM